MEILQFKRPESLPNLAPGVLAFDLEMANSFRNELPVICMIGTASYDPQLECCIITIASITKRHEEVELIEWFLEHTSRFSERNTDAKLVTFSGSDNDIPWINERIERYKIESPDVQSFRHFKHLDLRVQFHKRTQNNQMSLKKLETLFGIERESSMASRKVSYILTEILTEGQGADEIPEKIFQYLEEDVYYLMVILDRWESQSLESHHFTELEYLERCLSLLRHCRRGGERTPPRLPESLLKMLDVYGDTLEEHMDQALAAESFRDFALPLLPSMNGNHPEMERIQKKYKALADIELWTPDKSQYRLMDKLNRPKGTLAVVRQKGKVLMIKRAEHLERAPGFWGLPGGVMEKGETPAAGALRELKEEVNLDGEALRLMGTSASMSKLYELFWVEVRVRDTSPLAPNAGEVAEVRWVTAEEFLQLSPLIPGAEDGFRRFLGNSWAPRKKR